MQKLSSRTNISLTETKGKIAHKLANKKSSLRVASLGIREGDGDEEDDDELDFRASNAIDQQMTVNQILQDQLTRFDVVKQAMDKKRARKANMKRTEERKQPGDDQGSYSFTKQMPD